MRSMEARSGPVWSPSAVKRSSALGQVQAQGPFQAIWVVVKIMVPFWIPIIIRHLIFRVPKKGPQF